MKKALYLLFFVMVCAFTDYTAKKEGVSSLNIAGLIVIEGFAALAILNMKAKEIKEDEVRD